MQKGMILGAGVFTLLAVCLLSANVSDAAGEDEQEVKAATKRFYEALNKLFTGDAGPMKDAWSHAKDVTYMGPGGGFQVGWDKVEPVWDAVAAMKLGGKINPQQVHVTASPTLAVVCCYEKGENIVDGKPQPVQIRASTVFRKENGKWKVIGHQTDLLPFLKP